MSDGAKHLYYVDFFFIIFILFANISLRIAKVDSVSWMEKGESMTAKGL